MNSTGKEGGRVAALYTRVSTRKQAEEGYSLAAQRRALTEWAEQRGYKPEYYEDAGIALRISPTGQRCNDWLKMSRLGRSKW